MISTQVQCIPHTESSEGAPNDALSASAEEPPLAISAPTVSGISHVASD
jgi:hypothetical protein